MLSSQFDGFICGEEEVLHFPPAISYRQEKADASLPERVTE